MATTLLSNEFVQLIFIASLLATGGVWLCQPAPDEAQKGGQDNPAALHRFRLVYLCGYFLAVFSDWLQGPYVYALYEAYGFSQHENAVLFVFGFGSSMMFGTVVGSMADRLGRKSFCIVYCTLYLLSCLSKHVAWFPALLFGRVVGGIATSLLFSCFDAWLVCENSKRGFSSESLSETFSMAMSGNSFAAILAGVVAQRAADYAPMEKAFAGADSLVGGRVYVGGYCLPFDMASVVLVGNMFFIAFAWTENFGDPTISGGAERRRTSPLEAIGNALQSLKKGWEVTAADPAGILGVGLISAFYEASMYIFVFMWTPALTGDEDMELSFGLVFSSFMCMCMLGSQIFSRLLRGGASVVEISRWLLLLAGTSHASVALLLLTGTKDTRLHFLAFLIFELSVGMYFPTMATLKAMVVPENKRATVYSLFRFPLNFLVIAVLVTHISITAAFSLTSVLLGICLYLQGRLQRGNRLRDVKAGCSLSDTSETGTPLEGCGSIVDMDETKKDQVLQNRKVAE